MGYPQIKNKSKIKDQNYNSKFKILNFLLELLTFGF